MSVKRKMLFKEKEKAVLPAGPKSRKVSRSVKVDQLPDAIVDGAWTANPGDEVVIALRRGARTANVLHTYKKTTGDLIELWDEEQHRWFCFTLADALKANLPIKILFRTAAPAQ